MQTFFAAPAFSTKPSYPLIPRRAIKNSATGPSTPPAFFVEERLSESPQLEIQVRSGAAIKPLERDMQPGRMRSGEIVSHADGTKRHDASPNQAQECRSICPTSFT